MDEFVVKMLGILKARNSVRSMMIDLGLEIGRRKEENRAAGDGKQGAADFIKECLAEKLLQRKLSHKLKTHPVWSHHTGKHHFGNGALFYSYAEGRHRVDESRTGSGIECRSPTFQA
jgi:hypothetical protein